MRVNPKQALEVRYVEGTSSVVVNKNNFFLKILLVILKIIPNKS